MSRRIEEALVANGNIIDETRRAGKSLSGADRRIIGRNRQRAIDEGHSREFINAFELEGEFGRRAAMAWPVQNKFIGKQDMAFLGWQMRLYNIEGNHPLNNSTVSVISLLRNGLMPHDLTLFGAVREAMKEILFHAMCLVDDVFRWIANRKMLIVIALLLPLMGGCKSVKKALGIYHDDTDIYGPPTVEGIVRNVPDDNVVDFYFMRVRPDATIVGYVKNSNWQVRGDQWFDVRVTTVSVEPAATDEYIYVDRTTDIAYIHNSPVQRRAMTLYQVPPGYSSPGRPNSSASFTSEQMEIPLSSDHELY